MGASEDEGQAVDSPASQSPEQEFAALIDDDLEGLRKQREEKIAATALAVADQVLNELAEQLWSDGIDTGHDELADATFRAMWHARYSPRQSDVLNYHAVPSLPDLLNFVAAAVASGILGNVSYDLLKGLFRRWLQGDSVAESALEQVVLFAVASQCRRYQLSVEPSKIRVRKWLLGSSNVVAIIDAKGSEMTAEVTVPRNWRDVGVEVRIRDVSQRPQIERAAERLYNDRYGDGARRRRSDLFALLGRRMLLNDYMAEFQQHEQRPNDTQ